MLGKFIAGDFIAIAGEMRRFPASNENTGDAVHQPTWPLLLKIEHMVKLQVLGNYSKTVNNIKNLI